MAASLTSSRTLKEIQNLLLCDVCKKTINEPKTLSCSHSFCKACLENLVTQDKDNADEEGKKLNCPTCASKTTLKPDENLAGLPDNEFVIKLLTAVGPNRSEEASVCSKCQKKPSIAICMECPKQALLCDECVVNHDSWSAMECHLMVSLGEIINRDQHKECGAEQLSCKQHKDAASPFYCETCLELICLKCAASLHTKPGHTFVEIHEIYRKQQDAVKTKCATINTMLLEGNKAMETVITTRTTYEKTAKDVKEKHTAQIQKDEMIKTVADGLNKILADKIQEVEDVYDPACQKLSVQAETISNYVQKLEKSLQRTNDVLKNSKLEKLLSVQKEIDADIQTLQNEKPRNLNTFQVQVENPPPCMGKFSIYMMFMELAENFKPRMPNTVILKDEVKLLAHLLDFLNDKMSSLRLCYRASQQGWSGQQFHAQCNDKAESVVLVKVRNWIFGGYTDQTWQGQWKNSNASFLFSLRNPNNTQPFKCPIINGKNRNAIYCHPSHGATFGGGYDLCICNNANSNTSSSSNLGNTYQPPPGYQYNTKQTQSLFAGSRNFTPTEIEVFY